MISITSPLVISPSPISTLPPHHERTISTVETDDIRSTRSAIFATSPVTAGAVPFTKKTLIRAGPCPAIGLPTSHSAQISIRVSQSTVRKLLTWNKPAKLVPGPENSALLTAVLTSTMRPGTSELAPGFEGRRTLAHEARGIAGVDADERVGCG